MPPPNPLELLASRAFAELLEDLEKRYSMILIDSPPAGGLSDATLLAGLSDMVLLVVRHNQTDRDFVARTVQQLRRVGANLAGVVFNNVNFDRTYGKDYYYAGYYESEGSTERSRKRSRPAGGVGAGAGG